MFHKIKEVKAIKEYEIAVTFIDDTVKKYDVEHLFSIWDCFKDLKQIKGLFWNVKVDTGGYGIRWNNEIDLSCEELWENGVEIDKILKVTGVKAIENYQLVLTFSTGEKKLYDVKPLLEFPVYQPLKDEKVFCDVQVDFETVTWCNGEIDIAPETLYHDSTILSELSKV